MSKQGQERILLILQLINALLWPAAIIGFAWSLKQ